MPIGNFSYNPGVVSTVGETAARSNQMFGQAMIALMQGLAQREQQGVQQNLQHEEKAQAELQQGKAADAWRLALGEDAPKMTGMSDDVWKTQAPKDRWAAMNGVNQAQATKQVMGRLAAQEAATRQQSEGMDALMKFTEQMGQRPANIAEVAGGANAGGALGQSAGNAMGGGVLGILGKVLGIGGGGAAAATTPVNDTPTASSVLAAIQGNRKMLYIPEGQSLLMGAVKGMNQPNSLPKVVTLQTSKGPVDVLTSDITGKFEVSPLDRVNPEKGQITPAMEWDALAKREVALKKNLGSKFYDQTQLQTELADIEAQKAALKPGGKPAAAPATRQAVGAYKVGTMYKGGLKYLGGDPKDKASWEQIQ